MSEDEVGVALSALETLLREDGVLPGEEGAPEEKVCEVCGGAMELDPAELEVLTREMRWCWVCLRCGREDG